MDKQELSIVFQPSGRKVRTLRGTLILEAAARAGIIIQTPCGGRQTCGKCRVQVTAGHTDSAPSADALSGDELADGWRLACCTSITTDLTVMVPESSRFDHTQKILTDDSDVDMQVAPAIRALTLSLPEPTQEDAIGDLERLERAADSRLEIDPALLAQLPRRLRECGWRVCVVLDGPRVLSVEADDGSCPTLGVAFDLGTTTVVGTLLDLTNGNELAVASTMNGQIAFGDDVLARVLRVREAYDALADLQAAAIESLNGILNALCQQASVPSHRIHDVALAGNTTMQQILCGFDPSALGEVPFVPVFERGLEIRAADLGLRVHPGAHLYVFPQVGGFVGGDTVACMLAARIEQAEAPVLLVDIGTNGEIVLATRDRILCTSTAAGPAFEGARIRQGMRATTGAIEKVVVRDDDLVIHVIGDGPAVGLCGTALIDVAAHLLDLGVMDTTGRIQPAGECPETVPAAVRERLIEEQDDVRVRLADGDHEVCLWQRDIRELQLAAGAIRAGIEVLMLRAGITPDDLGEVLLAGAFGNFIRRNHAQRIGLLPAVPHERIRFIGNAASMGAKMALLSTAERLRADSLRERAEHIDLSADPEFQMAFGMAMMFPEPPPHGA